MKLIFCLVILLALTIDIWSLPKYQMKIPNGNKVVDPCTKELWPGVGHLRYYGTGPQNAFGDAFKAANFTWTRDLCLADTDGDGLSNGQELGDPNCQWKVGDIPSRTINITHPAISNTGCNLG